MRWKNKQKYIVPALGLPARRLFTLCVGLILGYLPFVGIYAWCTMGDLTARVLVLEMLHSAAISAVLALGGALLLDCELRAREKRRR
ncbi:MAG: hypothetical protein IIU58_07370 [Clostridia bacterium]|nr:hypothetical protein [Clostridia bacterium]